MEPMYIYATPAQVKKWQKDQEKTVTRETTGTIQPTKNEKEIKAVNSYEKLFR